MSKQTLRQWRIAKATPKYLSHTWNYILQPRKTTTECGISAGFKTRRVCSISDADWTNYIVDRRSMKGGFLTYNHMPIWWLSIKQDAFALSLAEEEYWKMTKMTQMVVYVRTLDRTFKKNEDNNRVVLKYDKMPVIDMIQALGATLRFRFIHMRHH